MQERSSTVLCHLDFSLDLVEVVTAVPLYTTIMILTGLVAV